MKLITNYIIKNCSAKEVYEYALKNNDKLSKNELDQLADCMLNKDYKFEEGELRDFYNFFNNIRGIEITDEVMGVTKAYVYSDYYGLIVCNILSKLGPKMVLSMTEHFIKWNVNKNLVDYYNIIHLVASEEVTNLVTKIILQDSSVLNLQYAFENLICNSSINNEIIDRIIIISNMNKDEEELVDPNFILERLKNGINIDEIRKKNLLNLYIKIAESNELFNIFDSKIKMDRMIIYKIVDEVIETQNYDLMFNFIINEIPFLDNPNSVERNYLGVENFNKLINEILSSYDGEMIYELADRIFKFLTEEQKELFRECIFKSNEVPFIVKYALTVDEEFPIKKFKSIERFYMYVKKELYPLNDENEEVIFVSLNSTELNLELKINKGLVLKETILNRILM